MHGRGLQWLIIPLVCLGCAGAPKDRERARPEVPARDVEDILLLVRDLVMEGACASDGFYSTDVMHRLFGSHVRAKQIEGDHARRVGVHGFEQLIRKRKATTPRPGSLDGVWFEARKPVNAASDGVCTFDVTFHGALRGSDFKSVVRVLPAPRSTIDQVADHIAHIRMVAGAHHVGLGADFDGNSLLARRRR